MVGSCMRVSGLNDLKPEVMWLVVVCGVIYDGFGALWQVNVLTVMAVLLIVVC